MEEILQRLGQRIREIRIQRGFKSQEEFADYCNLHRTFIGHLETGRKDFRLTTIIHVAKMLGVTITDLFAGVEGGTKFGAKLRLKVRRAAELQPESILREIAALERSIERLKRHASPAASKAQKTPIKKRMGRANER